MAALDVLMNPPASLVEPVLPLGLERARERYGDEGWSGFWSAMVEEPIDPEPQNVSMLTFMGRHDDALELADELYRTRNLGYRESRLGRRGRGAAVCPGRHARRHSEVSPRRPDAYRSRRERALILAHIYQEVASSPARSSHRSRAFGATGAMSLLPAEEHGQRESGSCASASTLPLGRANFLEEVR